MKKPYKAFLGAAISGLLATSCFSAPQQAERPALASLPASPAQIDVVTRYIEKTRGWKKDQYSMLLRHKDGNLWHFWIYFGAAHKDGMVGNDGKSFDAVLNIRTNHVEKELHFQ